MNDSATFLALQHVLPTLRGKESRASRYEHLRTGAVLDVSRMSRSATTCWSSLFAPSKHKTAAPLPHDGNRFRRMAQLGVYGVHDLSPSIRRCTRKQLEVPMCLQHHSRSLLPSRRRASGLRPRLDSRLRAFSYAECRTPRGPRRDQNA